MATGNQAAGMDVCEALYRTLCADVESRPAAHRSEADRSTSLYTAFSALCSHYDGDPLQAAVCARVLAFYFMMERSAGAAVADWVQPQPGTTELVELHPAVVDAIATVRLHGSVLLNETTFLVRVQEAATLMS